MLSLNFALLFLMLMAGLSLASIVFMWSKRSVAKQLWAGSQVCFYTGSSWQLARFSSIYTEDSWFVHFNEFVFMAPFILGVMLLLASAFFAARNLKYSDEMGTTHD